VTASIHGLLVLCAAFPSGAALADPPPINGLEEVSHDRVQLRGGFWGPRQKTHLEVTIPHALDCLEEDGHVTNFDVAAGISDEPLRGHHAFDSDLHKALEGALISLKHHDDPALRARVDDILRRILAAQEDDGFLISYYIVQNRDQKRIRMLLLPRLRDEVLQLRQFLVVGKGGIIKNNVEIVVIE